jgi:3',5'-cyclic AMP phosphodiesterase CpdA
VIPLPSPSALRFPIARKKFAIVGDVQRTSAFEVWRESNPREREAICTAAAAEEPDFTVLLGDLVVTGSSAAEWAQFDRLVAPLRKVSLLFPILGNHEYWMAGQASLAHYFARFPALEGRRWYSARYGPLAMIFLDSNLVFLRRGAWNEELAWYREELSRFDAERDVRGILVFAHHPPFTNSRVTADEKHVKTGIVPPMARTAKALAMFSGHVHSYERFAREGKTFVVSGGGGAPRAPLSSGRRRRHEDDLFDGPARRHFHFLTGELQDGGLSFSVHGLDKGGREVATIDRFDLPWSAA